MILTALGQSGRKCLSVL